MVNVPSDFTEPLRLTFTPATFLSPTVPVKLTPLEPIVYLRLPTNRFASAPPTWAVTASVGAGQLVLVMRVSDTNFTVPIRMLATPSRWAVYEFKGLFRSTLTVTLPRVKPL